MNNDHSKSPRPPVPAIALATTSLDQITPAAADAGAHPSTDRNVNLFHVNANANCYAVADLVVSAKDARQARKKGHMILDSTFFQITARTATGFKVFVHLMQAENVEIEILDVLEHDGDLPPVEREDIRARVEAAIGRLILSEMESLEIEEEGPNANQVNIRAGISVQMPDQLLNQLWELYVEVHPAEVARPNGIGPASFSGNVEEHFDQSSPLAANPSPASVPPAHPMPLTDQERDELTKLEDKWIRSLEARPEMARHEIQRFAELSARRGETR